MSIKKIFGYQFRKKRNRYLETGINRLYKDIGRTVKILDVGGRPEFWRTIHVQDKTDITLLNIDKAISRIQKSNVEYKEMRLVAGDARNLSNWESNSFDLVVSNSLIEHVGLWDEICAACQEIRRVGVYGWVQTPAFSFPIEPHFMLPFIHWFGAPIRSKLYVNFKKKRLYKDSQIELGRHRVEGINLLTKQEISFLFPECHIWNERFLGLTKSFVVTWPDKWWFL